MREVIIDTETTGLFPAEDRILEFAALEMIDLVPTGNALHLYINPQRDSDPAALKVHGLTTQFLKKKPLFAAVAPQILEFLGEDPVVAHNAAFDLNFMRAELARMGMPALSNPVVDTLELARRVKGKGRHSLDALCSFYKVDRSARANAHGALIDCKLLAEVYLHMRGGRQIGMDLVGGGLPEAEVIIEERVWPQRWFKPVDFDSLMAHAAFVAEMKSPIWDDYNSCTEEHFSSV